MAQIARMPLNNSRPKLEKLAIVFAGVTLSIPTHVDSGHGGIKPCLFSTMTRHKCGRFSDLRRFVYPFVTVTQMTLLMMPR
jgi:hypothetical protein